MLTPHAERLVRRAAVVRAIRTFFDTRDFVEIEAPILVSSPGLEPHLDAFEATGPEMAATGRWRRYLHTSPEYALKRLLGQGLDRLYSLGPCFRQEHPSSTHAPEFTMLEWYVRGLDLWGMMDLTEALVATACEGLHGKAQCTWKGQTLNLSGPFERLSVREAFVRYARVDPWQATSADTLRTTARMAGVAVPTDSQDLDDVFFQIFLNAVEPRLGRGRPTLLWGWPASQAALARLDPEDPSVALRFELYAGGVELANAFDELHDPVEQRTRFEADQAHRRALSKPVYPIDEALLEALPAMGPASGIALGVDRLVMLLTDTHDIAQVRPEPWTHR